MHQQKIKMQQFASPSSCVCRSPSFPSAGLCQQPCLHETEPMALEQPTSTRKQRKGQLGQRQLGSPRFTSMDYQLRPLVAPLQALVAESSSFPVSLRTCSAGSQSPARQMSPRPTHVVLSPPLAAIIVPSAVRSLSLWPARALVYRERKLGLAGLFLFFVTLAQTLYSLVSFFSLSLSLSLSHGPHSFYLPFLQKF